MIVSKSFCAVPYVFVTVCYASIFCQLAIWLDIVPFHVIICRSNVRSSSGFTQHSRISDSRLGRLRCSSERIQSLLTHLTPQKIKKLKLIFRTTKLIGTLPRIVGRGEIGPKSAQLSCGVYPALFLKKISVNLAPGSYISSLSSLLLFFYFTPSSIVILEFGSVPGFLYWCLPPPSFPPSLWSPHTPLFGAAVNEAACPWNSSNAFHWIPLLCLARPLKPSCCHPVLCQLCVWVIVFGTWP